MENEVRKQIITIAGRPGSGKSTAAKEVARRLNFDHFSSGDLFRQIAKQQGIDVLQANLAAEDEDEIPKIDHLVDEKLRTIGQSENKLVIDSRMAWHWIPSSLKVFLDLDLQTAASRILSKMTPERIEAEHIPNDPITYAKNLQRRLDSEMRRYMKIYKVSPYELNNYDLVINTAVNNPDEVASQILARFNKINK